MNGALLGVDVFDNNAARQVSPLIAIGQVLASMLLSEWTQVVSLRLNKMPNIRLFPRLLPDTAAEDVLVGVLFHLSSWVDYGSAVPDMQKKRKRSRSSLCLGGLDSFREFSVFLALSVDSCALEMHCELLFSEAQNTSLGAPGIEVENIVAERSDVSFGVPKVKLRHSLSVPRGAIFSEPSAALDSTIENLDQWITGASEFTFDAVNRYAVQTVLGEEAIVPYLSASYASSVAGLFRAYSVKESKGSQVSVVCLINESCVTLLVLPSGVSVPCSEENFCDLVSPANTVSCLQLVRGEANFVNICVTISKHVYVTAGTLDRNHGPIPPVCGAWAILAQLLSNWEEIAESISRASSLDVADRKIIVPWMCGSCVLTSTALSHEVTVSMRDILLNEHAISSAETQLCNIVLIPRCLQLFPSVSLAQIPATSLWVASVQWLWPGQVKVGMALKRFVESVVRNSVDEVSYIVDAHSLPTSHTMGAGISDTVVNMFLSRTFPIVAFSCVLAHFFDTRTKLTEAPTSMGHSFSSAHLWDSNRASFDVTIPSSPKRSLIHLNVELVVKMESTVLKVDSDGFKFSVNMEGHESMTQFKQALSEWLDRS